MNMFLYISVVAGVLIQLTHAAASSSAYQPGFIGSRDQQVILRTIKNGTRKKTLLGKDACNNTINGVLFGCIDPESKSENCIHALDIDPPKPGLDGLEKEVYWIVPPQGDAMKLGSHIRTNFATAYIARSDSHILLTLKKHGNFIMQDHPVLKLPEGIALVYLLLEISTKGKFRFSHIPHDDRPPQRLATLTPVYPPQH